VVDPQSRETFSIARCQACGLGHTQPAPPDLARYYGSAYYGGRHGFTARFRAARRADLLERIGTIPGNVLDIGCGEGEFLLATRERGRPGVGIELGPAARAARAAGLDVRESLESASALAPFAAVTLWHSLEHLPDPLGTLAAARRLLSPDGRLVVAVPDNGGWQARIFGRRWFHLDVPRHLYHFDARSLAGLLERAGFVQLRRFHMEIEYDVLGWLQSLLNTALPEPNALFRLLTRKQRVRGALVPSILFAPPLAAIALPLTLLSAACGRGGTLVVAARPAGPGPAGASVREGAGRPEGARGDCRARARKMAVSEPCSCLRPWSGRVVRLDGRGIP
jgi:SAM-dependent methyltransferase